ncbi:RNA polymerase sigma factor SigM [Streptomyces sp. SM12]|uniref:RNA polymerase sigma factor SigM n=1 Tax=unclassified Streptomyces TaxID=2593676 RepID=UPI002155FDE5
MPSDEELLARHVAGDPDAFGEIVRRHRDRLWAVARRTLSDPEEAADAVQDALVSAYRAAASFRGQAAVTTWLHRITVNACLDRARKAKSRRVATLPEPERLEALLEPHESAAGPAERQDLRRELREALDALPPEQRAALVLVDMEGYPVAEAARILETPIGTIKSRCARGRARLLPVVRHLHPRRSGEPEQRDGEGTSAEQKSGELPDTKRRPPTPSERAGPAWHLAEGGSPVSEDASRTERNRTAGPSVPPSRDTGETGAVQGGGGHQ